jgi:cob(I)alamin adenosyltransferase
MLEKGLVQIYTGDGKGKTTAALGLALRAAGQGNKVLIYQFLKCPDTSERLALQSVRGFVIESLGISWDMAKSFNDEKTVAKAKIQISNALKEIAEYAKERTYDLLILDEIVFCFSKGLAKLEDIKNVIDKRDPAVEIVLTGRGATDELIAIADLVTEMKNIKHPFDNGIEARRGIEF